MILNYFLKS